MSEPKSIQKDELLARLPPVWPDNSLRDQIAQHISKTKRYVVVLDDDPTGTQTVHDILVLTRWELEDLRAALTKGDPALYILTNSRRMALAQAQMVNREIALNLVYAAEAEARAITVVSRSDSTLRGHYPGEVQALASALSMARGVPFDGLCIIPFFPEGGRFTIHDVHWVQEGSQLLPASQTSYAQDPIFGYQHSRLQEWIEEKTNGAVPASEVMSVSLDTIRRGGPDAVAQQLLCSQDGRVIVVNAAAYRDLEVFVSALQCVEAEDKRFLFRTAASFVKVVAGITDRPLLTAAELVGNRNMRGGLIVFGSYVPKSNSQLAATMVLDRVEAIELPVLSVLDGASREQSLSEVAVEVNAALSKGLDAVVYTSREIVTGETQSESFSIVQSVSAALVEVINRVKYEPRYVLGKGGITSSDLATGGMGVRTARVMGQILPGVPAWRLGPQSRWPGLPFIVFPGNVGDEQSVAEIVLMLREQ